MANPFLSVLGLLGQNQQPQPQPQPQQNQNGGIFANLGTVAALYKMVKGSGNQQEALNQLIRTNADAARTYEYIKQNGGDMNKIANDLSNQAGVPLDVISGFFK